MRTLVTGGAGFLGSNLVARLLTRGDEVVVLDPEWTGSISTLRLLGVEDSRILPYPAHDKPKPGSALFVKATTEDALAPPFPVSPDGLDWIPDLIFHLGAMASPPAYKRRALDSLRSGSLGVHAVSDLAFAADARVVFASTSEVYGDPEVSPQPETYRGNVSPTGPRSMYDEAKRYGEAYFSALSRQDGVDVRIARIFNTYGPGMKLDDGRMIPEFARSCLLDIPLPVHGNGSQTRTLCYVDDLVQGLLLLADSESEELFDEDDEPLPVNLGGEGEVSVLDVATMVREAFTATTGREAPPILHVPQPCSDDPKRRRPDLTRARSVLDYNPIVPDSVGLDRTIRWWSKFFPG